MTVPSGRFFTHAAAHATVSSGPPDRYVNRASFMGAIIRKPGELSNVWTAV